MTNITADTATEEKLPHIYHRRDGRRKSYHKALTCTSGLHVSLPACSDLGFRDTCYVPALSILQSQSFRSLSCFSLPFSWLSEKTEVLHKDSKALVYNFSSLKGNICTHGRKKDTQNIILARITWKKSNEIGAQDTLF